VDASGYREFRGKQSTAEDMAGRIWDAASGKELAALSWPKNGKDCVRTALFSGDGSKIVTAGTALSGSSYPCVWDAKTGKLLVTLKYQDIYESITGAAFSPDGLKVATVSHDKTACQWDATTGKPLVTFKGHEGAVLSAAFSPDGQRLVTVSEDNTARIWDASVGREADARKGIWWGYDSVPLSPDGFSPEGFSPDGRLLLATYNKFQNTAPAHAVVWDTQTGRQKVITGSFDGRIETVDIHRFSPDGKKVITGSSDNHHLHVWDTVTGKELAVLGHENGVSMSAFSEDGRFVVATDGTDGHVWDAVTGKKLALLKGDALHQIYSARFSPDGKHVLTSGPGGFWRITNPIACVWDATTGTKLIWLKDESLPLYGMATFAVFRLDGKWLLTGSGQTANLWDLSKASGEISSLPNVKDSPYSEPVTGKKFWPFVTAKSEITSPQLTLKGHEKAVSFASFSPDGRRVVTASEDRTARIWDAKTGAVLAVLKGHEEGLRFASFSPDGKMVLTFANDNTVRLWNAFTGKEMATLSASKRWVRSAGFSTDGQRVLVGFWGEARVWPVDLLAAAKQRKPRDLTQAERERFELEVPAKP
jgi:WD40 repeat protein